MPGTRRLLIEIKIHVKSGERNEASSCIRLLEYMARVFISYAHESKEQSARVLALAQRLRSDGVDCFIGSPLEFDRACVLSGFLEDYQFGPSECHALGF